MNCSNMQYKVQSTDQSDMSIQFPLLPDHSSQSGWMCSAKQLAALQVEGAEW